MICLCASYGLLQQSCCWTRRASIHVSACERRVCRLRGRSRWRRYDGDRFKVADIPVAETIVYKAKARSVKGRFLRATPVPPVGKLYRLVRAVTRGSLEPVDRPEGIGDLGEEGRARTALGQGAVMKTYLPLSESRSLTSSTDFVWAAWLSGRVALFLLSILRPWPTKLRVRPWNAGVICGQVGAKPASSGPLNFSSYLVAGRGSPSGAPGETQASQEWL